MKRILIAFLIVVMHSHSYAQVNWIKDFNLARALALSNNKFIVMDFWAIWCGPCRTMDNDLWNSKEMDAYKDKFVYLKIDIDANLSMMQKYQGNIIPKVIIIDPTGEIIWSQTGFSNSLPFLKTFKSFPETAYDSEIFSKFISDHDKSAALMIGLWYQSIIPSLAENPFKNEFMNLSDRYLKIASNSEDKSISSVAENNLVLNLAIRGKVKKAIKQAENMDENDLKNYILAFCYQCEGEEDRSNEYAQKIESEELKEKLKNQILSN